MLVKVIDIFNNPLTNVSRYLDIVDHRHVLYIFAQANATCMRADEFAKFGGQHVNGQDLVQSSQSAGIDLNNIDRIIDDELLEQYSVLTVLTGGHFDLANIFTNFLVSKNIIRTGRFFDEPGVKWL